MEWLNDWEEGYIQHEQQMTEKVVEFMSLRLKNVYF